jgi:hypothetical protein
MACAIALAGCGGGGDEGTSTSANATVPQVTTPGQSNPNRTRTSTTPKTPGNNPTTTPTPRNRPPGGQSVQQALAPFRECVRRQGVSLPFLNGSAQAQQPNTNPEQYRAQVEKAFKCIPELPPRLKDAAEQFKRRFEQRTP